MEKSILARLEGERAARAPEGTSPVPSQETEVLKARIAELEARLEGVRERMVPAASIRNIEESKAATRKEISELLKAVREQQKYSELDRQMHDQLEKAWARVEEMEKRLLEVYSLSVRKVPEPQPAVPSAQEVAASAEHAIAGLEARFEPIETALRTIAQELRAAREASTTLSERLGPLESGLKDVATGLRMDNEAAHAAQARIAELSTAVDAGLRSLDAGVADLRAGAAAGEGRLASKLDEVNGAILGAVHKSFEESASALGGRIASYGMDAKDRLNSLSKKLDGQAEDLVSLSREGASGLEKLEEALRAESARAAALTSEMRAGLEGLLKAHAEGELAEYKAALSRQESHTAEIRRLYAAGLVSAAASVSARLAETEARVAAMARPLEDLVRALEPLNLDLLAGVSGGILRKSFESAKAALIRLKDEADLLAGAKVELAGGLEKLSAGLKDGGPGASLPA